MANVYIKGVSGGEKTAPVGTDGVELDDGATSTWTKLSNLHKGLTYATSTQINTGTDTTTPIPVDQFVASNRNVRWVVWRVVEKTTDWSADGTTGVGGDFVFPFAGTILTIRADVDTAGTTGTSIVDVNINGTTIMTTNKLKWDSTEKSTSTYSGTAPGLTTTAVAAGDIFTTDIDTNHTTKSKGLTIQMSIRMT